MYISVMYIAIWSLCITINHTFSVLMHPNLAKQSKYPSTSDVKCFKKNSASYKLITAQKDVAFFRFAFIRLNQFEISRF